MLVEPAEAHIERAEGAESFANETIKEDVLRKEGNNGVFKACLKQTLLATCSEKKMIALDMFFPPLGYQMLVPEFSVASNTYLIKNEKENALAREKLLNSMDGSEQLQISWRRKCVGVSPFQFENGKLEKDDIVVEEGSSLLSRVPTVLVDPARRMSEALALF